MWDTALCAWKAAIALGACVYLLRERAARSRRRRALEVAFGVAALCAYFHFGDLPYKGFFHRWEMFHYYLGSKYSSEVGYRNLYRCVAVADAETGARDSVLRRPMRDLATDALVPASLALERPEACTAHFSVERWGEFRGDVVWFRNIAGDIGWWEEMQQDHGYNAPPAFTLLARPLAELAPLGESALAALAALDLALMAAVVLLLRWSFGGRVAALAVIFWGTQPASEFFWTGGAFLRQDWLFFAILALALARKKRHFGAGLALAVAACLRVFPLLFFAGPLVAVGAAWLRRRSAPHAQLRFLSGGLLALSLLGGTSAAISGRENVRDFLTRVELRATSEVSNHMGLRTLFSVPRDDGAEVSVAATTFDATFARSRAFAPGFIVALLAALALWVRALAGVRSLWVGIALGAALVPIVAEPATYYFSFVLLAVPLTRLLRSLEIALLGLAGAGQLLALQFGGSDAHFTALALLYVVFALALSAAFNRKLTRVPAPGAPIFVASTRRSP